jgi:transcriptional regulator with PAS, ATPase and Fis domain
LFARALHLLSGRRGEFVAVNSAGLDDLMCADTLFGHASGAYTGAEGVRPGLVERAKGGTLFLDEIGDMTLASQAKLLRLLQEEEYTPLGSDVTRHSTARVVLATNRNLRTLQEAGSFRRDLYYRISTHVVSVPPLRERKPDIAVLLEHFLQKTAALLGRKAPEASPALQALLCGYSFPGNVRELESMVLDAVSRHRTGSLGLESFRAHIREQRGSLPEPEAPESREGAWVTFSDPLPTLAQAAELLVREALRRANGHQAAAAAMLGVTRQALNKRIRMGNAGLQQSMGEDKA